MPIVADPVIRERKLIPLNTFYFHRENINHDRFEVSITDADGTFRYQVRSWGNMIRTVRAFVESIAHGGVSQRAKRDVYMTGYAMANGVNIRVTPLSQGCRVHETPSLSRAPSHPLRQPQWRKGKRQS